MNDKEAREIRRRFKPDKTWINAVHGCYVNESKKVISTFRESVQTMVQDESERFLALLKKPISGTIGRSLINLEFSARQRTTTPTCSGNGVTTSTSTGSPSSDRVCGT